jgi:hypothetical protein
LYFFFTYDDYDLIIATVVAVTARLIQAWLQLLVRKVERKMFPDFVHSTHCFRVFTFYHGPTKHWTGLLININGTFTILCSILHHRFPCTNSQIQDTHLIHTVGRNVILRPLVRWRDLIRHRCRQIGCNFMFYSCKCSSSSFSHYHCMCFVFDSLQLKILKCNWKFCTVFTFHVPTSKFYVFFGFSFSNNK